MAKLLKLRRGTTSQHGSFTGAEGEVTVDTDKETLVVHDGSTAGGHPVAAEDMANVSSASIAGRLSNDSIATSKIAAGALPSDVTVASANIGTDQINQTHIADNAIQRPMISDNAVNADKIADSSITSNKILDGAIVNADVNASAAIAGTKISPDFGSQNITTSGTISSGSGNDQLNITHSGGGATHVAATGDLVLKGTDNVYIGGVNNETHIKCTENGSVELNHDNTKKAQTSSAGFDVIGNITVSGTVDGRDVASDGTKLDGIESGATADQTGAEIVSAINGQHIHTTAQIGYDSNDHFQFTNNTQLDLYINGNNEFRFEADGDFHADGDVTAFSTTIASDSRLKSDIHTINNALGIVGKLRGVSYKWLRDGRSDIGVIAQEVEEVIPEIVKTKTTLGLDGQEEMKTVDYGKIVGVLINAINELKEEVEELKNAKITG